MKKFLFPASFIFLFISFRANAQFSANVDESIDSTEINEFSLQSFQYTANHSSLESLIQSAACNPMCNNMGFENGTLSGWNGYYGYDSSNATIGFRIGNITGGLLGSVTQAGGPNPNTGGSYHINLQTVPGLDPVAGALIPNTPPSGKTAVMLGDGPFPQRGVGILEQSFIVDAANDILTLEYAVVFENPNHNYYVQPFFKMELLDQSGVPIPGCGQYEVVSTSNIPGFQSVKYGSKTIWVKPWATVFIPLSNYIGQCVTIRFTASDCAAGGHFGYAYVAANCGKLNLQSSSTVFCLGQKSATIYGPPGAASYQWSTTNGCINGSSTNANLTVTCGGTYDLAVTSTAGPQCSEKFSINIPNVNYGPPPVPCFTADKVCSGTPTTFDASCSSPNNRGTFYWDFYNYGRYLDSSKTPNMTNTFALGGYYNVKLHQVDTNGCSADTIIKIAVDTTSTTVGAPTTSLTVQDASSCNICNGVVTLKLNGGGGNYTVWSSCVSDSFLVTPTGKITRLRAGPATFVNGTITFKNVCPGFCNFYVVPVTALSAGICNPAGWVGDTIVEFVSMTGVNISAEQLTNPSICNLPNGSSTLTGTGGVSPYVFTWPNGLGTGPTQTGLSAGEYLVAITDATGCPGFVNVKITSFPDLACNLVPYNVSCYGAKNGAIKITPYSGSGPYSYAWNPPVSSNDSIGNLSAGVYNIVVTDASGCSGSYTATISEPTKIDVAISGNYTNIPCNTTGDITITPSGGFAPYSYSWSNGPTTPTDTGLTAGIYNVRITDATTCFVDTAISVTNASAGILTISPNTTVCKGATVTLSASGGSNYTWMPGNLSGSSITIVPDSTTTYSVAITDANGCGGTLTTTVTVNSQPTVVVNGQTIMCEGDSVLLSATGATNYSWNTNQTDSTIYVKPSVPGFTYNVTGTDAGGCSSTASLAITVNALPVIQITADDTICIGFPASLSAASPNATSYSWSPVALTTSSISDTPSQTTVYTVLIIDGNSCRNSSQHTVTVDQGITVTASADKSTLCKGQSVTLTALSPLAKTFSWNPGPGTSSIITLKPDTGTHIYLVTASDGYCTDTASTGFIVYDTPIVTAFVSQPIICEGASTILSTNSVGNVVWNPGAFAGTSYTVTPNTSTIYSVTVTDNNGCSGYDTLLVSVNPNPSANPKDVVICEGTATQLHANNSANSVCSWFNIDGTTATDLSSTSSPNPAFTGLQSKQYILIVSDAANVCPSQSDTVSITVNPIPHVEAFADSTNILAGTEVQLRALGAENYQWSPAVALSCATCSSPLAIPLQTTTYIVTAVDQYGCRNSDTVHINVEDFITLYVPNSFSPNNGDDVNNLFKAYGTGVKDFEFYIFDRWGTVVYRTEELTASWDGKYKGSEVQNDVFVYYAKGISITGKTITRTGTISLIR